MDELVNTLKDARETEAQCTAHAAEMKAQLEAIHEYQALAQAVERLAVAKQVTLEADAAVREAALAEYIASGNKHPHPAVTVKIYQVVRYDAALALEYARQHLPQALKLVKATFEKAARAIEIPGVEIIEEPRAEIATTL